MYYKIINDRMAFNTGKTIQLEYDHPPLVKGQWVSNPDESLILADGWQVFIPPVVPPTPQTEPGMGEIMQAVKKILSTDTEELSDEDALDVAALFPTWASKIGTSVAVGERLWYDEKLYKVIQAHTVQREWTPDVSAALFTEVSIIEWPEWSAPLGAADAYNTGDKVTHNGNHYISAIDANVWEPGSVGAENLWTLQP